jgi:hypothetical protein
MGEVEIRKRRSWRRSTYIWILSGLTGVSALIYWEQTALLFVLSTLAMCALLTVVALADLEGRDRELHNQPETAGKPGFESNPTTTSPASVSADSSTRKQQRGAA